jgi:hypothetical protein
LKKFIAGFIFATAIMPILDSATSVIITGLEALKGKWSIKIADYNYKIQKLGDEPISTRVIGFTAPTEEDDYEDD